ncbi:putative cytochrome [Rosellinia necatrix]|uniref:Putative cytochrome n=1 Tax=Rosellinia necatrix TaxID=77044 RepID=A0A1S8AA29_ROSNE|nr:putative cytochrome [Rosellinia necatrix]
MQETLQNKNPDFCTAEFNDCLYNVHAPNPEREIALYLFVSGTMVNAIIRALIGPYLHEVDSDIIDQVIKFNESAWMQFYGLPDFFGFASV